MSFILDRFLKALASCWALPVIVVAFLLAIVAQWNGPQAIAVADEIGYVTSGVNLVAEGQFINPWGQPEVWFPPVYPFLIGVGSLGGRLDPFVTARIISVIAGVLSLIVLHGIVRRGLERFSDPTRDEPTSFVSNAPVMATIAVAFLAFNPTFQIFANRALSESLALCFVLLGLRVWIGNRATEHSSGTLSAIVMGLLIGLAALTRPECILVAPLWCLGEWFHRRNVASFKRGLFCALTLACLLLPYATFLHRHTGQWTISNKGPVNLAAGRAAFHHTPREYIDEQTLELGYFPVDQSLSTELRRVGYNASKLISGFAEMYCRPLLAIAFAVLIGTGIALLWRARERRFVLSFAAGLLYLLVVLKYDVAGAKNLHLALPVFSVMAAAAVASLLQSRRWIGIIPVLFVTGILMLEGATRYPRWARSDPALASVCFREAGKELRTLQVPRGVMYEFGASTAYYSGMWRRYLTPNSLNTVLNYIARHETHNEPIYLTVSELSQHLLHESTRALLTSSDPRLERVLETPAPNRVVVYRVRIPSDG